MSQTEKTSKDAKRPVGRPKKGTTPPNSKPPSRPTTPTPGLNASKSVSFGDSALPGPSISLPPSSVPLASELENPPPVVPPKQVNPAFEAASRDELRNATIQALGAQQAAASRQRLNQSAANAAKERKAIQKELEDSELYHVQKSKLVMLLNNYRTRFVGKVNFQFPKQPYEVDWELADLMSHKTQVELILNTQHAPTLFKQGMVAMSGFLETLTLQLGIPFLDLNGFADNMEVTAQSGFFDDEIGELCIKYSEWFNQPPGTRLAGKVLLVGGTTAKNNAKKERERVTGSKLNPKVMSQKAYEGI